MRSDKKAKTSKNKATDVETKPKVNVASGNTQALYAKYGKLQVDREKMAAMMQQYQQEMIAIYQQIQELEKQELEK